MGVDALVAAACLAVIWLAGDRLVRATASLAHEFRIPQSVAGATLAAFGSSSPELATNAFALFHAATAEQNLGQADIGYATVLGSAIVSTTLVIGIPAMFRPLVVNRRVLVRDGLFYLAAVAMAVAFLADGAVTALEASSWVAGYGVYLYVLVRDVWRYPEPVASDGSLTPGRAVLEFGLALAAISAACYVLVGRTTSLALALGAPSGMVGLLAIAVGAALPDLVASIQAARQGNTSLALSNAIGTNCFDLMVALGLPTLVTCVATGGPLLLGAGQSSPLVPVRLAGDLLFASAVYLAISLAIALLFLSSRLSVERPQGALLIALYPLYLLFVAGTWAMREDQLIHPIPLVQTPLAIGILGATGSLAVLLGLVALSRWILSRGGQVAAVARHVLAEALAAKAALVPIALLLVLLPITPLVLDPAQPLRYRVQTALGYGLAATSGLLSLLTVLLATSAFSGEIFGRQIHTTIIKPIARWRYLLGRWLGMMWLNGLLLVLAGIGIGLLTMALANLPGGDRIDRVAIDDEILVAREARRPAPPHELDGEIARRLALIEKDSPDLLAQEGRAKITAALRDEVGRQWFSLGPRGRRDFVFEGLGAARDLGGTIQLRLKLHASNEPRDGQLTLGLQFNKAGVVLRKTLATDQVQTIPLVAANVVTEDGSMVLTIYNTDFLPPEATHLTSIAFAGQEGLEVLYPSGAFGPNLARALAIVWIKLGFLAMLALALSSYMTFPVACLTSLVVLAVISLASFLAESSRYYEAANRDVELGEAVGAFAGGIARVASTFNRYDAADQVVDGRFVAWSDLAGCAVWVGLGWTGLAALGGALVFQRRELARVLV